MAPSSKNSGFTFPTVNISSTALFPIPRASRPLRLSTFMSPAITTPNDASSSFSTAIFSFFLVDDVFCRSSRVFVWSFLMASMQSFIWRSRRSFCPAPPPALRCTLDTQMISFGGAIDGSAHAAGCTGVKRGVRTRGVLKLHFEWLTCRSR